MPQVVKLSKQQKDYLLFGFIKRHCLYTFPIVLIKLSLLYYDDLFYWKIQQNKLQKFLEKKKKIYSNKFFIKTIPFKCRLSIQHKLIQFDLILQSMSSEILYIDLYYELLCTQNGFQCKDYFRFTSQSRCSLGWNRYNRIRMKVDEYKKSDELDFESYAEILYIGTKQNTSNIIYLSPSTSILVSVHEGMLTYFEDEKDKIKPFRKEYKLNTKLNEIYIDAHKYFKYPFALHELNFHEYRILNYFENANLDHTLFEYYKSRPHTDGGRALFNFGITMDMCCVCPICKKQQILGYAYSKDIALQRGADQLRYCYDGLFITFINNQWKCGQCWHRELTQ